MFKTQEEFQNWLAEMQDSLSVFVNGLPPSVRISLDYSPNSLDVLEHWLLANISQVSFLREPQASSLLDGLTRYVGETYVRSIEGCRWDINLNLPEMIYANKPIVVGPDDNPFSDSPQSMVLTAVDRRRGNIISTSFNNRMNNRAPIYRGKRRAPIILNSQMWEEWLAEKEVALEYFISHLPSITREKLDYSPISLDALSDWLVEKRRARNIVDANQFPEVTDGAARYVGEVFIRTLDAKWDVILDKPSDPHFRFPFVRGQGKKRYKYCPAQMILFRVIGDKKIDYLRVALEKEIGK